MKNHILLLLAFSLITIASCKKEGCTDPTATNYDSDAKKDDGSCIYSSANATKLDCDAFQEQGQQYDLPDLGLPVDYIVECKIQIHGDLTIKPGVVIQFSTDAGLNVRSTGSINAEASAAKPIIFTGVDKVKGSWAGIFIEANDVKNKFNYCTIEYAGGAQFNSNGDKGGIILYGGASAEIRNCTISKSDDFGINANYGDGEFVFENNTISECTYPMFVEADYVGSINGGTYTGNNVDAIRIDTYAGAGYVTIAQTWNDLGVPYRVKQGGMIEVRQVSLNISPGVEMDFETGSGIMVLDNSSLVAVGTPDNLIRFRGSDGLPGSWRNIEFHYTQSPLNEIGYAVIEHAGSANDAEGAIYMWANPKLSVHDVQFKQINTCAFYDAPKTVESQQVVNPNLSATNNTYESIGNVNQEDTDPLDVAYCYGG